MTAFERITKETRVSLTLGAEGPVTTSVPMLTHFLDQLNLYGGLGLALEAEDLMPLGDGHHLAEDVAIALGRALDRDLAGREGRARYGQRLLPMDETLATVALDIGGRPFPVVDIPFRSEMLGGLATENIVHFFRTLALEARFTLHLVHAISSQFSKVRARISHVLLKCADAFGAQSNVAGGDKPRDAIAGDGVAIGPEFKRHAGTGRHVPRGGDDHLGCCGHGSSRSSDSADARCPGARDDGVDDVQQQFTASFRGSERHRKQLARVLLQCQCLAGRD